MDKQALFSLIDQFSLLSQAEKVYGPYEIQKGRKIVILVDEIGNRRTVSLPKYLMEQHLERPLTEDETVDHINSDVNDNRIENFRLLPRDEHSREDTRRVKLVEFECPECKEKFERSPRLIRDKANKGRQGPFCSRECSGKHNRKVQLGLVEKLPSQQHVDSEYYKQKNIAAMAEYLLMKYSL